MGENWRMRTDRTILEEKHCFFSALRTFCPVSVDIVMDIEKRHRNPMGESNLLNFAQIVDLRQTIFPVWVIEPMGWVFFYWYQHFGFIAILSSFLLKWLRESNKHLSQPKSSHLLNIPENSGNCQLMISNILKLPLNYYKCCPLFIGTRQAASRSYLAGVCNISENPSV